MMSLHQDYADEAIFASAYFIIWTNLLLLISFEFITELLDS